MEYFISRDDQKYGPYTLSDLQRYVAAGQVLYTDLATSDGLPEPVPVAQIIGTIAVPPPALVGAPVSMNPNYADSIYPDPPNLHWGLVLLFAIISCGLFVTVWDIVQAAWIKKLVPQSNALYIYLGGLVLLFGGIVSSVLVAADHTPQAFTSLFQLADFVVIVIARFSFRKSMEDHYNTVEPMGLSLSGVMTFFFGSIYFQYHINDIMTRKHNDRIYAMTR